MIIIVKNASEALQKNDELRELGLINGQDYSWRFIPFEQDASDPDNSYPPRAEFQFRDPKMESFLQLKWN